MDGGVAAASVVGTASDLGVGASLGTGGVRGCALLVDRGLLVVGTASLNTGSKGQQGHGGSNEVHLD